MIKKISLENILYAYLKNMKIESNKILRFLTNGLDKKKKDKIN